MTHFSLTFLLNAGHSPSRGLPFAELSVGGSTEPNEQDQSDKK